jgi:hypothetical protein
VPASGPALEKLNDRKVILSAPKSHVKRSQAQTPRLLQGAESPKRRLCHCNGYLFGIRDHSRAYNLLLINRTCCPASGAREAPVFSPIRVHDTALKVQNPKAETHTAKIRVMCFFALLVLFLPTAKWRVGSQALGSTTVPICCRGVQSPTCKLVYLTLATKGHTCRSFLKSWKTRSSSITIGVGKNSHIPAGQVLARSAAKPRYCRASSALSWLGYNEFELGFVDMLQRTLVGAHRLARYHRLRSNCC